MGASTQALTVANGSVNAVSGSGSPARLGGEVNVLTLWFSTFSGSGPPDRKKLHLIALNIVGFTGVSVRQGVRVMREMSVLWLHACNHKTRHLSHHSNSIPFWNIFPFS